MKYNLSTDVIAMIEKSQTENINIVMAIQCDL